MQVLAREASACAAAGQAHTCAHLALNGREQLAAPTGQPLEHINPRDRRHASAASPRSTPPPGKHPTPPPLTRHHAAHTPAHAQVRACACRPGTPAAGAGTPPAHNTRRAPRPPPRSKPPRRRGPRARAAASRGRRPARAAAAPALPGALLATPAEERHGERCAGRVARAAPGGGARGR